MDAKVVAALVKDLHMTLADEVLSRLDKLAHKLDRSRNYLLREAVEDYIRQREREALAHDMAHYADEMAAHSGEFIAETDSEVNRMLLEHTEW